MNHVQRFDPFQRPFGGVEGAEALHRPPPPPDETVILLDDVRQVFGSPQVAIEGQHLLLS